MFGQIKPAAVLCKVDLRFVAVGLGVCEFAKVFRGYLFISWHPHGVFHGYEYQEIRCISRYM